LRWDWHLQDLSSFDAELREFDVAAGHKVSSWTLGPRLSEPALRESIADFPILLHGIDLILTMQSDAGPPPFRQSQGTERVEGLVGEPFPQ
jgi:hypothetical protein